MEHQAARRGLTMTNIIEKKLQELNITLDEASKPAGSYVPYVISNNLVFISNGQTITFENFNAQLRYNKDIRIVNINSTDALSGIFIGEYDFFN